MKITKLMEIKGMTSYRLAKISGIPYSTVNDICNERARLEKCSAETVFKISKALGVSMESLVEPCLDRRPDFELFKSSVCHRLKELGDTEFIISLLEEDEIQKYYEKRWIPEALYLLAMLDYVSRENNVPLCTKYDNIRSLKLKQVLFPAGIMISAKFSKSNEILKAAVDEAIPEFLRFNIVESEVRNVI